MKNLMLLFVLLFDLAAVSAQSTTIVYNIPAAGQTVTISPPAMLGNASITLGTRGNVNLGSNTYTLTYSSIPATGSKWTVIADFRKLTQSASGANVTIFGVKPLQAHPTVDTFNISFSVLPDSVGTKYLYYTYIGLNDGGVINGATVFNAPVRFNAKLTAADTAMFFGRTYLKPTSAILAGYSLVAADTGGRLTYGAGSPWYTNGNSGLTAGTNFLGTTDNVDLVFKRNNVPSGLINASLANTAFGYVSLYGNTTGEANTALGVASLTGNTTGDDNTGIGNQCGYLITTGLGNTGVGASSLPNVTTGDYNTAVGTSAGGIVVTGSQNIFLGVQTQTATTSTSNAIVIGNTAVAATNGIALGNSASASQNQLAIAGIRTISIPNATNSIRYVLTDTSGTGDFVPQPNPIEAQTTYTPLTGDSVSVSTTSNLINPAGTIANFTIRLPASPYSGQLLEFSSTQIITSLHWSVALNQSVTAAATLPSSIAAGGTVKIMYNSATTTWYNW
jgi:hypothetical protein